MFVVSFVILIFIGTVLLTLPISAKSGRFTNPVDALFTATSAACVTGLSVYDTFIHWSYFGQGVLLVLIQCGGLGLAAFATGLTLLVRRRIGIRHLVLARESAGGSNLDVISLLRIVVAFTFAVEALGALLLMARFVPLYGGLGVWASVFVSVSAFCNAGFDILSFIPGNSSLSAFNSDPLVTLTIAVAYHHRLHGLCGVSGYLPQENLDAPAPAARGKAELSRAGLPACIFDASGFRYGDAVYP